MTTPPKPPCTAALALIVVAAACKPAATGTDGGDAPVGRNATGTRARVTLTAEGARVQGTLAQDGNAIEGARVEVLDAPASATVTGAGGDWSLAVPAGQPAFVRVSKASFRTVQSGVSVAGAGAMRLPLEMVPAALLDRIFHGLGLAESASAGVVAVRFNLPDRLVNSRTRPAGFGATLSAGGGTAAVMGNGQPARGSRTIGGEEMVLVLNVAPGTTTVAAQAAEGFTCAPTAGVLTTVRVDPQVITFVSFDCR